MMSMGLVIFVILELILVSALLNSVTTRLVVAPLGRAVQVERGNPC